MYVSPLKALSNDIRKNLDAPLSDIRAALREQDLGEVDIRTWVRTGDTPAGERQRMGRTVQFADPGSYEREVLLLAG